MKASEARAISQKNFYKAEERRHAFHQRQINEIVGMIKSNAEMGETSCYAHGLLYEEVEDLLRSEGYKFSDRSEKGLTIYW